MLACPVSGYRRQRSPVRSGCPLARPTVFRRGTDAPLDACPVCVVSPVTWSANQHAPKTGALACMLAASLPDTAHIHAKVYYSSSMCIVYMPLHATCNMSGRLVPHGVCLGVCEARPGDAARSHTCMHMPWGQTITPQDIWEKTLSTTTQAHKRHPEGDGSPRSGRV